MIETQREVVEHCQCSFRQVFSGVPQSSVLGPTIFLIYINDIHSVCCGDSRVQVFADDAKLYLNICLDNPSVALQLSLDNLISWANAWQVTVNIGRPLNVKYDR